MSRPTVSSNEYLLDKAKLNEFEIATLRGLPEAVSKIPLSPMDDQRFKKTIDLLFTCDARTPEKSINNVILTYQALEDRGFRLSMHDVFNRYEATIASEASKQMVRGFVKYYRNHPEFLYGSLDVKSKVKTRKILCELCGQAAIEGDLTVAKECLEGAFAKNVISEEELYSLRKQVIDIGLKRGSLTAEEGFDPNDQNQVNRCFESIPQSDLGQNSTSIRPPKTEPFTPFSFPFSPVITGRSRRSSTATASSFESFDLAASSSSVAAASGRGSSDGSIPSTSFVVSPLQSTRSLLSSALSAEEAASAQKSRAN